jgi:hypothetical protein
VPRVVGMCGTATAIVDSARAALSAGSRAAPHGHPSRRIGAWALYVPLAETVSGHVLTADAKLVVRGHIPRPISAASHELTAKGRVISVTT